MCSKNHEALFRYTPGKEQKAVESDTCSFLWVSRPWEFEKVVVTIGTTASVA